MPSLSSCAMFLVKFVFVPVCGLCAIHAYPQDVYNIVIVNIMLEVSWFHSCYNSLQPF
jgi:hypothetical protein